MKGINLFAKIVEYICGIMLTLLTVSTFAQVVSRYVFNHSFNWSEELAIYVMVWMVYLGAAINVLRGGHTRIDFFINLMPYRMREIVEAVGQVICGVFSGYLAYNTLPVLQLTMRMKTPALRIPTGVMYISVLVCGVCMIVFFAIKTVEHLRAAIRGKEETA
jgi:TRAP-type C4-dicarboxylate transport system permease small subunit